MNFIELRQKVDDYLTSHMDATFWHSRSEAEKTAALSMSKNLVCAELRWTAVDDSIPEAIYAIAEQAVYLTRNYDAMREGKIVTSEGVGDLSVGYTLLADSGWSMFAQMFLAQAKKATAPALIRIGRG